MLRSSKRKSRHSRTRPVQALRPARRPRAYSARSKFLRKKLRSRTGPSASSTRSSAKPTSNLGTTNAKYKPSSRTATSGKTSTRKWPRSTTTPRRSSMSLPRSSTTSSTRQALLSCRVVGGSRSCHDQSIRGKAIHLPIPCTPGVFACWTGRHAVDNL